MYDASSCAETVSPLGNSVVAEAHHVPEKASLFTAKAASHSRTPAHKPLAWNRATATGLSFRERYRLGRCLGFGACSSVRVAVDRATGRQWACKIVTEESERNLQLREVFILQQLDHPNVLQYREHFNERDHLYIITELLHGEDVLSALIEKGSFCEEDAREIMRQVLSALAYLDSKGIAHRDLKLGNLVLVCKDHPTRLKIIDFGLSGQLSESQPAFNAACGTPAFLAPEVVFRLPYGTSCDVWAAGVVLFTLLSGDLPFRAREADDLLKLIKRAQPGFCEPVWEITSSAAKDLVQTLMTANTSKRPSAEAALRHLWLRDA